MKAFKLAQIWRRHQATGVPLPSAFVETGTYYAKTTLLAHALGFSPIHTIELSAVLHERAVKAHGHLAGITWHLGDSRTWVPKLAAELAGRPVFWYLDAHWFNVADVAEGPLPLMDELAAIAQRTEPDIICIDDAGDFGLDRITPEWLDLSLAKVAALFPGHREAVTLFDQAVIYR